MQSKWGRGEQSAPFPTAKRKNRFPLCGSVFEGWKWGDGVGELRGAEMERKLDLTWKAKAKADIGHLPWLNWPTDLRLRMSHCRIAGIKWQLEGNPSRSVRSRDDYLLVNGFDLLISQQIARKIKDFNCQILLLLLDWQSNITKIMDDFEKLETAYFRQFLLGITNVNYFRRRIFATQKLPDLLVITFFLKK